MATFTLCVCVYFLFFFALVVFAVDCIEKGGSFVCWLVLNTKNNRKYVVKIALKRKKNIASNGTSFDEYYTSLSLAALNWMCRYAMHACKTYIWGRRAHVMDIFFQNCQQQCGFICVPSVISVCIFCSRLRRFFYSVAVLSLSLVSVSLHYALIMGLNALHFGFFPLT